MCTAQRLGLIFRSTTISTRISEDLLPDLRHINTFFEILLGQLLILYVCSFKFKPCFQQATASIYTPKSLDDFKLYVTLLADGKGFVRHCCKQNAALKVKLYAEIARL